MKREKKEPLPLDDGSSEADADAGARSAVRLSAGFFEKPIYACCLGRRTNGHAMQNALFRRSREAGCARRDCLVSGASVSVGVGLLSVPVRVGAPCGTRGGWRLGRAAR